MAYTVEEKQKFIELRAKGKSFDVISQELNISKPTLIKWSGELYEEVQEAHYFELENLVEQYKVGRKARFESYCIILKKAIEELQDRAEEEIFRELPTEKLLNLVEKVEARVEEETQRELIEVESREKFRLYGKWLEVG